LLKEFSVESGSVFATAYRASPAILHDKTTMPQHTIFRAWPYFWERERECFRKKCMWWVAIWDPLCSYYQFLGHLEKKLKKIGKKRKEVLPSIFFTSFSVSLVTSSV
jgi:hypothetical protein